jgi:Ca2+-binding EF-hand superfamily protein
MKKLFLMAAVLGSVAMTSGAVLADNHGDHKKGKMMERVDTDGDGMISKAEFMAKHESKFMEMDVNGDGSLSKDEMKDSRQDRKDKMKKYKEKMEN